MKHDLLCTWLGLADKRWPPDPFLLLGVNPGEKDTARIEQNVHERLCRLRSYQVSHPEEATEGMNCLAQAFILVTDSLAREKCTNAIPDTIAAVGRPNTVAMATPVAKTQEAERDWQDAPPPVRANPHDTVNGPMAALEETVSDSQGKVGLPAIFVDGGKEGTASSLSGEIAVELARRSSEARTGLFTLPELLQRITHTRKLMIAWKRAGKYLRNRRRRLAKASEELDLASRMDYLFEVMEDYPAFVGHPGKPGYRVMAMARLEKTAHMYIGLDDHQREELARDWEAGERVLREHRRFLLERLKAMKRRGWVDRLASALSGLVREHTVWVVIGCILLAGLGIFLLRR